MNILQRLNLILYSIRFRLALWFVFILGILLVGFSGLLYYMQIRELRAETIIRLESKLENIERAFGVDPANSQIPFNAGDDETAFQQEDVFALYGPDRSLLKMWGPTTQPIGLDLSRAGSGEEHEPLTETLA